MVRSTQDQRGSASTPAAAVAAAVPAKKVGFCVPQSRTALAKAKSRKSSIFGARSFAGLQPVAERA
jgi:hypothetical protein